MSALFGLPESLANVLVLLRLLHPLREQLLVEPQAVLIHRIDVAQSRDDEVYDGTPGRNNPDGVIDSASTRRREAAVLRRPGTRGLEKLKKQQKSF